MKIRRLIFLIVVARLLVVADSHWDIDTAEEKQTAEGLIVVTGSLAAKKLKESAIPVIEASRKRFFTSYSSAALNELPSYAKGQSTGSREP